MIVVGQLLLLVLIGSTAGMTSLWFKANEQRLIANGERENARHALRVTNGTLDYVVTEVDDQISHLAGGVAARKDRQTFHCPLVVTNTG